MHPLKDIIERVSNHSKQNRADIFRRSFLLTSKTKILDLGSENGSNINLVLKSTCVSPKNVYIADIVKDFVKEGHLLFGYKPIVISGSNRLPFPDKFFEIVYCSSVIEHVTGPKDEVRSLVSGRVFKNRAFLRQKEFAQEIVRLGKSYFVQTPYKWFPIESHTWLPFFNWFPRPIMLLLIRITNRIWVKKTTPDWCLLTKRKMLELFPSSYILKEQFMGLTKSIMAIKCDK